MFKMRILSFSERSFSYLLKIFVSRTTSLNSLAVPLLKKIYFWYFSSSIWLITYSTKTVPYPSPWLVPGIRVRKTKLITYLFSSQKMFSNRKYIRFFNFWTFPEVKKSTSKNKFLIPKTKNWNCKLYCGYCNYYVRAFINTIFRTLALLVKNATFSDSTIWTKIHKHAKWNEKHTKII